jgi:hypothetical protein
MKQETPVSMMEKGKLTSLTFLVQPLEALTRPVLLSRLLGLLHHSFDLGAVSFLQPFLLLLPGLLLIRKRLLLVRHLLLLCRHSVIKQNLAVRTLVRLSRCPLIRCRAVML